MSEDFSGGAVIIYLAGRRRRERAFPDAREPKALCFQGVGCVDEKVEELKDRILARLFPFIKPTNNDAEQDGA